MSIFKRVFPLGIGTNRLPISDPNDKDGLEKSVRLITEALDQGCSYVDVTHTYSKGMAIEACRRAFLRTSAIHYVTVKSSYLSDTTYDDAFRRIEQTFYQLGIDHAGYFVCWNIS